MVNHKQGDMPCAPIPRDQPYDVDCSWIRNRLQHVGGTGLGDGIGASEGEQYLAAFAYGLTLLISGEMAGGETTIELRLGVVGIMLGAFLFAYIIGSFSSILQNLSTETCVDN